MKLGIVGLPNVGKSTLFNALTKAGAEAANYPFCTIDPNVGVVAVPDERIRLLGVAGLVKGASKGEGLGNQFLANIREVDAIVHVVRCFENENVIHVDGSVDPLRDIETINLELVFADLEVLERRISKVARTAKMDKEAGKEMEFLKRVREHLEGGKPASLLAADGLTEDEEKWLQTYNLLTDKPVIYAANVSEDDLANDGADNEGVQKVREYAAETNSGVFVICASIESEIAELDDDEKAMFLEDLGVSEAGLDKLVKASYTTLGLGPSRSAPKLPRPQARSTATSNADSSRRKSSTTRHSLNWAPFPPPAKKAWLAWRARTTSSKTVMSSCSDLTYKHEVF